MFRREPLHDVHLGDYKGRPREAFERKLLGDVLVAANGGEWGAAITERKDGMLIASGDHITQSTRRWLRGGALHPRERAVLHVVHHVLQPTLELVIHA